MKIESNYFAKKINYNPFFELMRLLIFSSSGKKTGYEVKNCIFKKKTHAYNRQQKQI